MTFTIKIGNVTLTNGHGVWCGGDRPEPSIRMFVKHARYEQGSNEPIWETADVDLQADQFLAAAKAAWEAAQKGQT